MRSQIAFVLLGCVLGIASLGAMRKSDQDPVGALLAQLRSDDPEERSRASRVLEHNHAQVVAVAIQITASSREEYRDLTQCGARMAAPLLAKYYSPNSLAILVRNVDYFQETWREPFQGYLCAAALFNIGPSAFPAMVAHLRTSAPEDVSDRAIYLFARIMNAETGDVEELILTLRRAEQDAEHKANLRRLLAEVEAIALHRGIQVK